MLVFCAGGRIPSFSYYKITLGYFPWFWNTDIIASVDWAVFVQNAENLPKARERKDW
jgi:hypothetical protein